MKTISQEHANSIRSIRGQFVSKLEEAQALINRLNEDVLLKDTSNNQLKNEISYQRQQVETQADELQEMSGIKLELSDARHTLDCVRNQYATISEGIRKQTLELDNLKNQLALVEAQRADSVESLRVSRIELERERNNRPAPTDVNTIVGRVLEDVKAKWTVHKNAFDQAIADRDSVICSTRNAAHVLHSQLQDRERHARELQSRIGQLEAALSNVIPGGSVEGGPSHPSIPPQDDGGDVPSRGTQAPGMDASSCYIPSPEVLTAIHEAGGIATPATIQLHGDASSVSSVPVSAGVMKTSGMDTILPGTVGTGNAGSSFSGSGPLPSVSLAGSMSGSAITPNPITYTLTSRPAIVHTQSAPSQASGSESYAPSSARPPILPSPRPPGNGGGGDPGGGGGPGGGPPDDSGRPPRKVDIVPSCLLYTSDAADE